MSQRTNTNLELFFESGDYAPPIGDNVNLSFKQEILIDGKISSCSFGAIKVCPIIKVEGLLAGSFGNAEVRKASQEVIPTGIQETQFGNPKLLPVIRPASIPSNVSFGIHSVNQQNAPTQTVTTKGTQFSDVGIPEYLGKPRPYQEVPVGGTFGTGTKISNVKLDIRPPGVDVSKIGIASVGKLGDYQFLDFTLLPSKDTNLVFGTTQIISGVRYLGKTSWGYPELKTPQPIWASGWIDGKFGASTLIINKSVKDNFDFNLTQVPDKNTNLSFGGGQFAFVKGFESSVFGLSSVQNKAQDIRPPSVDVSIKVGNDVVYRVKDVQGWADFQFVQIRPTHDARNIPFNFAPTNLVVTSGTVFTQWGNARLCNDKLVGHLGEGLQANISARFVDDKFRGYLDEAVSSFIGVHSNGTLSSEFAPVSTAIELLVPIRIYADLSLFTAAVVPDNIRGTHNVGTMNASLQDATSQITIKREEPREGTLASTLGNVLASIEGRASLTEVALDLRTSDVISNISLRRLPPISGTLASQLDSFSSGISLTRGPPRQATIEATLGSIISQLVLKREPPREGVISSTLGQVTSTITAFRLNPRKGPLSSQLENLQSSILLRHNQSDRMDLVFHTVYSVPKEYDLDIKELYFAPTMGQRIGVDFNQNDGLVGSFNLRYGYPNSVTIPLAGVTANILGKAEVYGRLNITLKTHYAYQHDLDLKDNLLSGTNFYFEVSDTVMSVVGVVGNTIPKIAGSLQNCIADFRGTSQYTGVLVDRHKPVGFDLLLNEKNLLGTSFQFGNPSIDDVSSSIRLSHLDGVWGRWNSTLGSVRIDYAKAYQGTLSCHGGTYSSSTKNLNIVEDLIQFQTKDFRWHDDALKTSASILLNTRDQTKGSLNKSLADISLNISANQSFSGVLRNDDYVLPEHLNLDLLPSSSFDTTRFNWNISSLGVGASFRLARISPIEAVLDGLLQDITVDLDWIGHVWGNLGWNYLAKEPYDLSLDSMYRVPELNEFDWPNFKLLEDVVGHFNGGGNHVRIDIVTPDVTANIRAQTATQIVGSLQRDLQGVSAAMVGRLVSVGFLQSDLLSVQSNISGSIIVYPRGSLQTSTGDIKVKFDGKLESVGRIDINTGSTLATVIFGRIPSRSVCVLDLVTDTVVFDNKDNLTTGRMYGDLSPVDVSFKLLQPNSGVLEVTTADTSCRFQGKVSPAGRINLSTDSVTTNIRLTTPIPVIGGFVNETQSPISSFRGKVEVYGHLRTTAGWIKGSNPALIKGFTSTRGLMNASVEDIDDKSTALKGSLVGLTKKFTSIAVVESTLNLPTIAIRGKTSLWGTLNLSGFADPIFEAKVSQSTVTLDLRVGMTGKFKGRIPLYGGFVCSLGDVSGSMEALVPTLKSGFMELQTEAFKPYIKGGVNTKLAISLRTENLRINAMGVFYRGEMKSLLSPFSSHIQLKKGPPLDASFELQTESVSTRVELLTLLHARMDLNLQNTYAEATGRVPIPYYGMFVSKINSYLSAEIRLHREINKVGYMDCSLDNVSPMIRVFVDNRGWFKGNLGNINWFAFGTTPISISGRIHPVLEILRSDIRGQLPIFGYVGSSPQEVSVYIEGTHASGSIKTTMENLKVAIRLRTKSQTKGFLEIEVPDGLKGDFKLKVSTWGTVQTNTDSLSLDVKGRIPVQVYPVIGMIPNVTLDRLVPTIKAFHMHFKLQLDLTFDNISWQAKGHIPVIGDMRGHRTLDNIHPEIQMKCLSYLGDFHSSTQGVSSRLLGYSKNIGILHKTLVELRSEILLTAETRRTVRIDIKTDDAGHPGELPYLISEFGKVAKEWAKFGILTSDTQGRVVENVYGRMDCTLQTMPWFYVNIQGWVPYAQVGHFHTSLESVKSGIVLDCPYVMKINLVMQNTRFFGYNHDQILLVSINTGEKLKSDISGMIAPAIHSQMSSVLDDVTSTVKGKAEVYGGMSGYTNVIRQSLFLGEIYPTGSMVGGDYFPHGGLPQMYDDNISIYNDAYLVDLKKAGVYPLNSVDPNHKKYSTLQPIGLSIVGEIPIPYVREGVLDLYSIGETASGKRNATEDDNQLRMNVELFYPWWLWIKFKGMMHLVPSDENPELSLITNDNVGFRGKHNNPIVGKMSKELVGIEFAEINLYRGNAMEGDFHKKLQPVKWLMQGSTSSRSSLYLFTDSIVADFTWANPMPYSGKAKAKLDDIRPNIKGEITIYTFGWLWSAWTLDRVVGDLRGNIAFYAKSRNVLDSPALDIQLSIIPVYRMTMSPRLRTVIPLILGERGLATTTLAGVRSNLDDMTVNIVGTSCIASFFISTLNDIWVDIHGKVPKAVDGYLGENQLAKLGCSIQAVTEIAGNLLNVEELDLTAEALGTFIVPIVGTLDGSLENSTSVMIGGIPVFGEFEVVLEDCWIGTKTMNGYFGDLEFPTDDLNSVQILLKRYFDNDEFDPLGHVEIKGSVDYQYDRNRGSKIRVYDEKTDEFIEEELLSGQETSYVFADIPEGSYYVVGTPNHTKVKSLILDEITITLN